MSHAPARSPGSFFLLFFFALSLAAGARAGDPPPPPDSALSRLVRKLASAKAGPASPGATKPRKEDLLRPEFRFKMAAGWLLLPELAKQLSTNEVERAAVLELMNQGATETDRLLAAQGSTRTWRSGPRS